MNVLREIPEGHPRGWKLLVNGEEIMDIKHAVLRNERFGQWSYGMAPGTNYDTWSFHEVGGGGSVILPYSIIGGEIFVGVIQQFRYNMGAQVWHLARGGLNPGESHICAARRELEEETRIGEEHNFKVTQLGCPMNPNCTFFQTGPGEGVHFFGIEIPSEFLTKKGEVHIFDGKHITDAEQQIEFITACEFWPYSRVLALSDMISVAGTARLIAELQERKSGKPHSGCAQNS